MTHNLTPTPTPTLGSTSDSYGETQTTVVVGGATVRPGDVVVGDADGIVVGSVEAFEAVVGAAEATAEVEERLVAALLSGETLSTLSNVDEHAARVAKVRFTHARLL